jgi:hypothetical protein
MKLWRMDLRSERTIEKFLLLPKFDPSTGILYWLCRVRVHQRFRSALGWETLSVKPL